jgi:N-acetylglutamate synthase/N-acetylornithine aminotransferase
MQSILFLRQKDQYLTSKEVKVIHAKDDADCLIAHTAISESLIQDTAVIGEDTNLLVLLCCHANLDSRDISFIRRSISHIPKLRYILKRKQV